MLLFCITRLLSQYWCSAHVVSWVTRHLNKTVSLGTWSLDHSALDITRHLNTGSLGTWYHSALDRLCITRHLISLGTWTRVHSALDVTRHLIMLDHSALSETGLLGTRLWLGFYLLLGMYSEKWLSVLTLSCQTYSLSQQSPPLTWVAKTLN